MICDLHHEVRACCQIKNMKYNEYYNCCYSSKNVWLCCRVHFMRNHSGRTKPDVINVRRLLALNITVRALSGNE